MKITSQMKINKKTRLNILADITDELAKENPNIKVNLKCLIYIVREANKRYKNQ